MKRIITTTVAALGILAFGAANIDACPAHKSHSKAHKVQRTYYTGDYGYQDPNYANYGYSQGYYAQPYGYNSWSGWDANAGYVQPTGTMGIGFYGM